MPQMAQRTAREARAVQLALAGWSYDSIAEELGYASRSGAWKAVKRALAREVVEGVREFRALEMARLDALQLACWDRAMDGDVKAVGVVLRIIDQRVKLLGLDREQQEADQRPTLVLGGTKEELIAGLRQIDAGA